MELRKFLLLAVIGKRRILDVGREKPWRPSRALSERRQDISGAALFRKLLHWGRDAGPECEFGEWGMMSST
jgi:hypothetical protein